MTKHEASQLETDLASRLSSWADTHEARANIVVEARHSAARRRRRGWISAAIGSGAVLLAVGVALPQVRSKPDQVATANVASCTVGEEEQRVLPSKADLDEMGQPTMRICQWNSDDNGTSENGRATLERDVIVPDEIGTRIMSTLQTSTRADQPCSMIDSVPPVSFTIVIQGSGPQVWSIPVGGIDCLGFTLNGDPHPHDSDALLRIVRSAVA